MAEYHTTDTDELAPYPDMTSDDLRDFETYCDVVEEDCGRTLGAMILVIAMIALLAIASH